jgi:hypothetical protein
VCWPLAPHLTSGDAAKLRMHHRNQAFKGRSVPLSPCEQEFRDLSS